MALEKVTDVKKPETVRGLTVAGAMQSDKTNWEYVTLPEEDALGNPHPPIGLNSETFEAGKTYLLPPAIAAYVKDRLKVYARSAVRVLSPRRDVDAENRVALGSANARAFGHSVQAIDATTIQTQ